MDFMCSEQWNRMLEELDQFQLEIKKILKPNEEFQKKFLRLQRAFLANIEAHQKEMAKRMEYFLKHAPQAVRDLALYGWYSVFSLSPRDTIELAELLKVKKIIDVDQYFVESLKTELTRIEEKLVQNFPQRKKPIEAAFRAHHQKEYYLSIPVFLAQADGICCDLTGIGVYEKSNKKLKIGKYVENQIRSKDLMEILGEAIKTEGMINFPEDERKKFPGRINRHEILHGESFDYGTETNSFKAISFIDYVGTFLEKTHQ